VRELLRAQTGEGPRINLIDLSADQTKWVNEKKALKKLTKQQSKLFELQSRLWAEQKRSVLIAMQGMDTSGKDGTVKHVMTGLNPGGVDVHSFKAPTPEEKRHNFLWRFKNVLPPAGTIGIFNRTYYEDVLIARVKKLVGENTIENRYGEINRFEQQLVRSGTVVIKLFLHIDYDEQRRRLAGELLRRGIENRKAFWGFGRLLQSHLDNFGEMQGVAVCFLGDLLAATESVR